MRSSGCSAVQRWERRTWSSAKAKKAEMTPKQGESENTGGKRIKKSAGPKRGKRKREENGGRKIELIFVAVAFQFKFFLFLLVAVVLFCFGF